MPAVRSRGRADDARPKPRSDAYVGLLVLSLLALSAAMLFAFLNYNLIAEKPKAVQVAPAGGGGPRPVPGPPVGGPAVNPGGQQGRPPAPVQPGGNQPPQKQPPPQKK